jgi:hypothetical protein
MEYHPYEGTQLDYERWQAIWQVILPNDPMFDVLQALQGQGNQPLAVQKAYRLMRGQCRDGWVQVFGHTLDLLNRRLFPKTGLMVRLCSTKPTAPMESLSIRLFVMNCQMHGSRANGFNSRFTSPHLLASHWEMIASVEKDLREQQRPLLARLRETNNAPLPVSQAEALLRHPRYPLRQYMLAPQVSNFCQLLREKEIQVRLRECPSRPPHHPENYLRLFIPVFIPSEL